MSKEPEKADIARMLRAGASAVLGVHQEYCISSDNCTCYKESDEMLAAANALDGLLPEEQQWAEDLAVVNGVHGFPIFDNEEQGKRYFAALERLNAGREAPDERH
jgi:hypothetical protein